MVNSKPPRGLQLNLTEANNGARAARVTEEGQGWWQWKGESAEDRLRTWGWTWRGGGASGDSRAAAVNTNNGEYRSVNCVLGSAEGGCARARPRPSPSSPVRCPRAILSLYPSL